MKKCAAYSPLDGSRQGWAPCARKAEEESLFCREHGEAIAGAVLGLCVNRAGEGQRVAKGRGCSRGATLAAPVRRELPPPNGECSREE